VIQLGEAQAEQVVGRFAGTFVRARKPAEQ
jgi:hypothetical protein